MRPRIYLPYGLEQVYIAYSDNRIPLEQIPEGDHSIHLQKLPYAVQNAPH